MTTPKVYGKGIVPRNNLLTVKLSFVQTVAMKKNNPDIAVALIHGKDHPAQRAAIKAWAEQREATVAAWYTDNTTMSRDIADRPALLSAILDLRKQDAAWFICPTREAVACNAVQAAVVERMVLDTGARLVCANGRSVNDGTTEYAFLHVLVEAVAQFDHARVALRTQEATEIKAARGRPRGPVPYGKKVSEDGTRLEIDALERKALAFAIAEYQRLGHDLEGVARSLNRQGHRTRAGMRFRAPRVRYMLQSVLPDVVAEGDVAADRAEP